MNNKLAVILFILALAVTGYFVYQRIKSQSKATDKPEDTGGGAVPDSGLGWESESIQYDFQ